MSVMRIDTSFDFRTDASGKDPDAHSATLRQYHRFLWSKPLPCGRRFHLEDAAPNGYLCHRSELGEFFLSSDSIVATLTTRSSMKHIIDLLPEVENEAFRTVGYTMAGMLVFPQNQIEGKHTINQARGIDRSIGDRFDLTLECIRRHYLGQRSPLDETLSRYRAFFALFGDFCGYVDFFLLQDLVTDDGAAVRFFLPFDDFTSSPMPRNVDAYKDYRRRSIEFVEARNRRIAQDVDFRASAEQSVL